MIEVTIALTDGEVRLLAALSTTATEIAPSDLESLSGLIYRGLAFSGPGCSGNASVSAFITRAGQWLRAHVAAEGSDTGWEEKG